MRIAKCRNVIVIIGILLLLQPSSLIVHAQEPIELHMEQSFIREDGIHILFNSNLASYDQNEEINTETLFLESQGIKLSLQVDRHLLNITSIQTVEEAKFPTTYLFMVDVSGSLSQKQMIAMKQILNEMMDRMKQEDNAALMTIGNDATYTDFTTNRDSLKEEIQTLEIQQVDTNLYRSVMKALDVLSTNNNVHEKRCLVVLSDGRDDYTTGITREEVEAKIKEAHLPIYTVAMLEPDAKESFIESAKIFGGFARQSAGGLDFNPITKEQSEIEIAEQIIASLNQGYYLSASLSPMEFSNHNALLQLELSTDEYGTIDDGYDIPVASIVAYMPDEITEVTDVPESNEDQTDNDQTEEEEEKSNEVENSNGEEDKKSKVFLIVISMVGVVLICITFIVILLRKKRKTSRKETLRSPERTDLMPSIKKDQAETMMTIPKQEHIPIEQPKPKVFLHFTKIGLTEHEEYNVSMMNEIVIGRDDKKSNVSFPEDAILSGRHCRISYQERSLYLEDLGSLNGTYLNGIPVHEKLILNQEDIIFIGSMELRITWNVNEECR